MRFDDRLSTVLGMSADAPRDRAVQWRQLVELVARGAAASAPSLLQRALDRIAALTPEIPDPVRAAAARAIAGPGVPKALVVLFVDRTDIAAPLLASGDLDPESWAEIRSLASPDVQELMDLIRPPAVGASPDPAESSGTPAAPPTPPLEDDRPQPALFRWECGPTGEIDWVEGAPRAALIGRSLADDFQQRFAARLPFSEEPLVLADEGALAGEWKWSGTPAFFPDTGRFAGYHGSARRGDAARLASDVPSGSGEPSLDSNRLRELIHELRTPLTAIIGFGEIIEGQILGPAHRAYRNRAAEIVRQARRLLAAVDDLDLAAKLRSGKARGGEGTPVGELVSSVAAAMNAELRLRGIELRVDAGDGKTRIRLEPDLAERLLRRLVLAIGSAATEGEELSLTVRDTGRHVGIAVSRPRALSGISEEQLFDPAFTGDWEGGLGIGFALRLARGLAAIAGGDLAVHPGELVLDLPSVER